MNAYVYIVIAIVSLYLVAIFLFRFVIVCLRGEVLFELCAY